VEFGRFGLDAFPVRSCMELAAADRVVCRAEVSAADVQRFGASLSSAPCAWFLFFNTDDVKFTAWPELVRLFPNLARVWAFRSGLVEFPLALCALPKLRELGLPYNDFVAIPSEVSRLQQLERFFLEGCTQLQRLPSSMSTLTALSTLNLEGCNRLPQKFNAEYVDDVQDALVKIGRHFARFEHCRAVCVTLIGLRRFKRDTVLLSQPLDITVLVAKLLWQARDQWPVV
jgi:Leucine-rich repeat (LRR) protein